MAAVTLLGTATFNTTNGTKTVTATPAVDDLIILLVAHSGNTSAVAPTDNNSDGFGNYSLLGTAVKSSSGDTMKFWAREKPIGSATSTVFTTAPGTTTGGGLAVMKVTGMFRFGRTALKQVANQDNQTANGTPAPLLANDPTSGPCIGAVFNALNPAAMTVVTDFTELVDTGWATPTTGIEICSKDGTPYAPSIFTWGNSTTQPWCALGIHLDISAAPSFVPADRMRPFRPHLMR